MDFSAEHASRLNDWRGRDGYAPTQYLSAKRPVRDPDGLVNPESGRPLTVQAHKRNLNAREKAASGGVYAEYRRVFLVPVQVLPEQFECKPADLLTTPDGVEHTVQATQLQNYDTQWRLETLALVLAFDLRDVVQIERAAVSADQAGAYVKLFPPDGGVVLYAGVPARVQIETQDVADTRGQRSTLGHATITVGRQVSLSPAEDRVRWVDPGGAVRYFDVKDVHNTDRIDELPTISAELRP